MALALRWTRGAGSFHVLAELAKDQTTTLREPRSETVTDPSQSHTGTSQQLAGEPLVGTVNFVRYQQRLAIAVSNRDSTSIPHAESS